MEQVSRKIDELRKKIRKYDKAYYIDNSPLISDREYDELFKSLQELEAKYPELISPDSPTQRVGSDLTGGFIRRAHEVPMLSLSNTYSRKELEEFEQSVLKEIPKDELKYSVELKFDGVSVSIIYRNRLLEYALTRGDGYEGDDITHNVRTIKSVPLSVPDSSSIPRNFEVRGEALIYTEDFERINSEREKEGEKLYANSRNLTAGSLKLLDPKIAAKRQLNLFAYSLRTYSDEVKTHSEGIEILRKAGFNVYEGHKVCNNLDEVWEFIQKYRKLRPTLPFGIDGVVIKVDSLAMQEELGYIARSPRWAIAYKYEAEQAETLLEKINLSIGRTGAVTPVAKLRPVSLAGSTISSATLHNADYIAELDIREGDSVYIEKGGDVIPKVTGVNLDKRPVNSKEFHFPEKLENGTPIYRPEGEVNYYCDDLNNPQILRKKIEHFVSRTAMNIQGFGERLIEEFTENGIIGDITDIYRISVFKSQIVSMEGFGEKSFFNLVSAIEESKKRPFEKVLYALGIRFIGERSAKILANHFINIDNLRKANKEQLEEVYDIGSKMADSILAFFADEKNIRIIADLQKAGLNFETETAEISENENKLAGKTFVFTGELQEMTRKEAAEQVEKQGGKETKSVSGKTSYVVVGMSPGSKFEKAQKLGVEILSEKDFLNMLNV